MTEHAAAAPSLGARLLLRVIAAYRFTAVLRSPRCRFHPTCSQYAVEAIELHGALRGSYLAVRRIGRCHPFNSGGVDQVPPRSSRPSPPTSLSTP